MNNEEDFFRAMCDLREASAGMLLRQCEYAEARFSKLWQQVGIENMIIGTKPAYEVKLAEEENHGVWSARQWLDAAIRSEPEKAYVVRLARWNLQFEMHRAQITYLGHANGSADERREIRRAVAKSALRFYHFGAEILRHVQSIEDGNVWRENALLRAHAGLYYYIANKDRRTAQQYLDDADSFLDEFPLGQSRLVSIIVKLRRAEAKLVEAGSDSCFSAFRKELRAIQTLDSINRNGQQAFNNVLGLCRDASACLRLVEAGLADHPKSRWWWWTYIVLATKVMEYFYCCRLWVASNDLTAKVIPSDSADLFWGGAIRLLESKQLNDLFFLSRLLWAYLQAAKAHAIFHYKESDLDKEYFVARIKTVVSNLQYVEKRLNQELIRAEKMQEERSVDGNVIQYARMCSSSVSTVKSFLNECYR